MRQGCGDLVWVCGDANSAVNGVWRPGAQFTEIQHLNEGSWPLRWQLAKTVSAVSGRYGTK